MISHRGFHYSNFGWWDPRCDVTFLNLDLINEFSKECDVKGTEFAELVMGHEFEHRSYYGTSAILEIGSQCKVVADAIENYAESGFRPEVLADDSRDLHARIERMSFLLDEIDPILDSLYSVHVYGEIHKMDKKTADLHLTAIGGLIRDYRTKRLFDSLRTVAEAFDWDMTLCHYMVAIPLMETEEDESNFNITEWISPYSLFCEICEIFQSLAESSKLRSSSIYEAVRQYQRKVPGSEHSLVGCIIDQWGKYGSVEKFHHNMKEGLDEKTKKLTSARFRSFGRDVVTPKFVHRRDRYDRMGVESGVFIFQSGGSFHNRAISRSRMRVNRVGSTLKSFLYADLLDSAWQGEELECVLCRLGDYDGRIDAHVIPSLGIRLRNFHDDLEATKRFFSEYPIRQAAGRTIL